MDAWPQFDIEPLPPRLEPTPRWIRVKAAGEWIADSRTALLLAWYGPGRLPTYCLPATDVRADLLEPSGEDGDTRSGEGGDRFMVEHDVVVGGQRLERAAALLRDPPEPFAAADGHWTFTWREPGLEWYEEATRVYLHARDPQHRVDAIPSERHVRVELEGEVLAESRRPLALFETTLPTRWYLPAEDVRAELLEPSDTVSTCPYKGTARYWSARADGELHRDVAWSYAEPIPENPRIAGLIAFFNECVDLVIDGERLERPFTPWSLDTTA